MDNRETGNLRLNPMNGLVYDIDEVDGALYMFSHECTGCVMLSFSQNISSVGKVFLNGVETNNFKIVEMNICEFPIICVQVRGYITEYNTSVPLSFEEFFGEDGKIMQAQTYEIKVLPRRDERPEKYIYNDSVAFRAAAESMVLLKNDGTLPFKEGSIVNLLGRGVAEFRSCAVGAGRINPRTCRNLVQAIRETGKLLLNEQLAEFYKVPSYCFPDDKIVTNAKQKSDTAVIVITRGTGENIDNRPVKGEFYLSEAEENLIRLATANFNKTVVLLNIGYPIDVSFLDKYPVNACLYCGYGGMYGAEATVSIMDGSSNPCGRLPDTWASDYFDIPAAHNFLNFSADEEVLQTDSPYWSQICYKEGPYIGYRYFTSFKKKCAFPFGFGLSYTQFVKEFEKAEWNGKELKTRISITNTGDFPGKSVVQLYISKPDERLEQVKIELADFAKTKLLKPGEMQSVNFSIPAKHFASYSSDESQWLLLSGVYSLYSGENAEDISLIGSFEIKQDTVIQQTDKLVNCNLPFTEMSSRAAKALPDSKGTLYGDESVFVKAQRKEYLAKEYNVKTDGKILFEAVQKDISLADAFVMQMTDEELCRLSVCSISNWNMDAKGEAGWTYAMPQYGLPAFALADGNNGVNIAKPNIGMPSSCMIAASFDTELAYEVGKVIAHEARENGINILLGPAMNLHRNPLNGRNAEYFSEDPLLAGVIAGNQNKGFQDNGVSGCIKHIVANNCEAVRKRSNSVISERTLREIYLKAFAYAMEITPSDTAMTGYNAINGCFCDEDAELLEGILREEMGFDGFIMSDWNSYDSSDMIKMVKAGISFLTPGSDDDTRVKPLVTAIEEGKLSRNELIRNVTRMIKVLARRNSH